MKELFNIVGTLTMNEKRYFKTHTRSKSALILFDLVNSNPGNFSVIKEFSPREKNYLFNSILRVLREYHSEISTSRQLDNYIHEIDILINKELYEIARKRIVKAEKIAIKYEKNNQRISLLRLKRKLSQYQGIEDKNEIPVMNEKIVFLGKLLVIESQIEVLISEFREEAFSGSNTTTMLDKEIKKINEDIPPELKEAITAHYLFLRMKGFMLAQKGRYIESYDCYRELIARFENQVKLANSSLDAYSNINYISVLHNMLTMLKQMDHTEEYLTVIEKLKKTKGLSLKEANKSFLNLAISHTDYCIIKNEVKQGVIFLENYKTNIESIISEPDRKELLYFNATYLNFLDGNYKEAHWYLFRYLSWVNIRYKAVFKAANFINVLLQLEMDKSEFALYTLERVIKRLKKGNQFTYFDEVLSALITAFLSSGTGEKTIAQLDNYSKLINEIKQNDPTNLNQYFNFKSWAESKIYKRRFLA